MKTHGEDSSGGKAPSANELLTPAEAARFLRVSLSFLAKARMRGDGPKYHKLCRAVRYLRSDLVEWLKARTRTSTSEAHAKAVTLSTMRLKE